MLMIHWLPSGGSMRRSASGRITWRMVSRRDRPSASARFAEAFMYGEHRAASDFRDIGARVYHDGHYRRGEGVDAQIAKGHRQRKVDEHNLHHNRGAANDFNKDQRDVVGDPAAEAAGETGHQTNYQTAGRCRGRKSTASFWRLPAKSEWQARWHSSQTA